MTLPGPDMGITPAMRRAESNDPTECQWCGGDIIPEHEADEAFWGYCADCEAEVAECQIDTYEWTPTAKSVTVLAKQLADPSVWSRISAADRAEWCDGLAAEVSMANRKAHKERLAAVDANRARTEAS